MALHGERTQNGSLPGTLVALLATWLSIVEILPGWYKEPRIQGEGYSGEHPGKQVGGFAGLRRRNQM